MIYEYHKKDCEVFQAKYGGWAASRPPVCTCKESKNEINIEDPAEANICDGCQ